MGKRGPQPWQPTDADRRIVEHYVAIGYTQEQIGRLIGKSVDSLDKYCRDELDLGALRVNAKVGGALYKKAMDGDTVAMIWWSKSRMGWKETSAHEHSGPGGKPIATRDMSKLTDDQLAALAALDDGDY